MTYRMRQVRRPSSALNPHIGQPQVVYGASEVRESTVRVWSCPSTRSVSS